MKKYAIEIKWGLIFVSMTLIWMLLEKLVGLHGPHIDKHYIYTNLIAIPAFVIYAFALLEKRKKDYNGIMTWKQGFISGLIITLVVTILSPLSQIVTSTIITPEYFPNIIEYSVSSGKMDQAMAEQYFNLKSYVVQGLIGAPVMGLITSAIVAFFTKKSA